GGRNQKAARVIELSALEIQQGHGDRIESGRSGRQAARKECCNQGCFGAVVGKNRETGIVAFRAGRKSAALTSALAVDAEAAELFLDPRTAEAAAKDVLLDRRTRLAGGVQEVVVGVEHVVAEVFVGVAVQLASAGFQDGIDVAAAIAALAGVIKRRLYLE